MENRTLENEIKYLIIRPNEDGTSYLEIGFVKGSLIQSKRVKPKIQINSESKDGNRIVSILLDIKTLPSEDKNLFTIHFPPT